MFIQPYPKQRFADGAAPPRAGVIIVLTAFCLVVLFAFVALSVDSGRIVLTRTQMQSAVDAAALAAAQEITVAVEQAGEDGGSGGAATAAAVEAARAMAVDVAAANGVFIDPTNDVQFGKRGFDHVSGNWTIQWGVPPYNVVRIKARRTGSDTSAPDGELPLAFGWSVGRDSAAIQASAIAFVESRDIVVCLDFSASMNDDSSMRSFGALGQSQVEDTLDDMWDALVAADPSWPGTGTSKFPASGFGEIDSYYGTYLSSSDTNTIYAALGLDERDASGNLKYPFPQAGRYSSGLPKARPSNSTSASRWKDYIYRTRKKSGTYRKRYGYRTLMDYLQEQRYKSTQSEDLWRTSHYPFHAVKEGCSLFLNFLSNLEYGDEVGIVSYGGYSMKEWAHTDGEVSIDISNDPITSDYASLNALQRRHQAGDYDGWTGMGYAIQDAREMLNDFVRYGSRPTMLIMTDGQTNQGPDNWSLPAGFRWADWTDYDGDGNADYSTTDRKKQYAFHEAVLAVEQGVTIHTLAVGSGADRDLMRAIAFAGSGIFISVPGGSTIAELEEQVLAAFNQIAGKVPPAQLIYDLAGE